MSLLPNITHYAPGKPIFQPYGTGGGGNVSTFQTASISSLTVSSINGLVPEDLNPGDWSLYPAIAAVDLSGQGLYNVANLIGTVGGPMNIATGSGNEEVGLYGSNVNLAYTKASGQIQFLDNSYSEYGNISKNGGLNISTINTNTLNVPTINSATINASTITVNKLIALSTITAISTLSTTIVEAPQIVNLSTINGLSLSTFIGNSSDWSLYPSLSTVQLAGYDMVGVADLYGEPNQPIYITTDASGSIFFRTNGAYEAMSIDENQLVKVNQTLQVDGLISTPQILVSSINGVEFSGSGGGSITISTLATSALSTIGASIQQGLMSSINIKPTISPTFNVDMGLGNFGIGLGTGLFAIAVAVPTTVGTLTYGITKGLASLFEPKPVNNITNSNFEVFNYQSQLQVSTLGNYISTCYTFLSTIPSTVVINTSNINSTIDYIDYPFVFSTVSQSSNPTCIRAIADPTQTISTPWTYSQALNDYSWVELPSSIGGGGGLSNLSSINVSSVTTSTLFLSPSTILQSEASIGGIMRILEPDLYNLGQLETQGVNIKVDMGTPSDGIYTGLTGVPYWIDQNFSTNQILLNNKNATVSTLTAKNILTPNPVIFTPPDLDQPGILRISTLTGDDRVGTILDTENDGSVKMYSLPSVPGTTSISTAITLAGARGAVGILNGNPQALLDVGPGLNYASPNTLVAVSGSVDGTMEVTLQNQSTGSNASAFFFAVENTGNEYAGFGVNSMNLAPLNNTLFEIPGASIQSGTLDCVIGPQSDHSSNSGTYLTYQDGAFAHHINSNGAISYNASYTGGTVSEGDFGTAGSLLQTNGSGSTPSWVSSFSVRGGTFSTITTSSISGSLVGPVTGNCSGDTGTFSTLNTQLLNLTTPSFASPTTLIDTAQGGNLVAAYLDLTPIEYVTSIYNLDTNVALRGKANINLVGSISSVGVHKIPEAGYALDVEGTIKATSSLFGRQSQISTMNTQVISTFGAGVALQLNAAADIELTPAGGTAVNINDGAGPAGNQSGLLRFGETNVSHLGYLGPETFIANNYYPGSYSGGWTNYSGRAVRVEYAVQSDSSFGGGLGKAEVTLPVGLSTVACVQGTYVAFQDSSPGLTHPIWLYSTINDGNGQISTVQVGAGQNCDLYVSVLGYL